MSSLCGLILSAWLAAPATAPTIDGCRYYVVLFGGQSERNRPQTAHTWATFVKGRPGATGGGTIVESFTISWLPVRLPVKPFQLVPEPGRNYGLHETLQHFHTRTTELGLWGPYEIRADWYASAACHKRFLDSGAVRFNTLDRGPLLPRLPVHHPDISHCVHAVTRTWEPLREASNPVAWYGELITRKVAERMDRVGLLVRPCQTHDWLLAALGVDGYRVTRRWLGEPVLALLR